MVSFTDIVEAFNMLKESKNSGLSPLEAAVMISYVLKDLLIVAGILRVIVWFKQVKEEVDDV
mgnify:FL=1|jgi:uncharacterized membrane protein HdeD (DUF308 family)|tara:strand:- start:234 stop:419 length:186 start_codon:yes stop_codon:yes gene_type:complete